MALKFCSKGKHMMIFNKVSMLSNIFKMATTTGKLIRGVIGILKYLLKNHKLDLIHYIHK